MGFGWAHGHRASGFGPVFKAQASAIGIITKLPLDALLG